MSETSSRLRLIAATTNLHPDDRQLLNDAADELQFLTARAEAAEARIATIKRETLERAVAVAEAWYYATVGDGTPHEEIRAMIEEKTDE